MIRYDYVTLGHVTRDVIEDRGGDSRLQPGGSAFYSALQAARLGLRTLILTQGIPGEIEASLEGYRGELDVHVIPTEHTTTLSTRGTGTERVQRLLAWAGVMSNRLVELDTSILHLAPVARETPARWSGRADFVGITPQGLIRQWQADRGVPLIQLDASSMLGDIPLAPLGGLLPGDISLGPLDPAALPSHFDAAVIGEQECHSCGALFAAADRSGALVAVTAGSRPTTLHLSAGEAGTATTGSQPTAMRPSGESPGRVAQAAVPQIAAVRDDLGAGDVFAAAFFVALSEGRAPLQAATFGNAAAAVRIASVGPDAIGDRPSIDAVLRELA